jgi:phospholipid N-methyltransferase
MGEKLKFFFNFLMNRQIGSITPTSVRAVRSICEELDLTRPVVVVEYGPGTGVFTRHLLANLKAGSRLVAIERDPFFAEELLKGIGPLKPNSAVLSVVQGDAQDVDRILSERGIALADYVISGIPFSLMKPSDREGLVKKTHSILKPDGVFAVYQANFQLLAFLLGLFAEVKSSRVWFNIPPLAVMYSKKTGPHDC